MKAKTNIDGGGLRDNAGKLRIGFVPTDVILAVAQVLTEACTTRVPPYPERNWERGMPWSKVTESLERHLADIKLGHFVDAKSKLRASAHLACNAMILCAYDLRGMHHLDDLEPFARAAARKSRKTKTK